MLRGEAVGGFRSDSRPSKLRGFLNFIFAFARFWGTFLESPLSTRRILVENGHSEGVDEGGGVRPYFRPPQLRGFPNFNFCVFAILGNQFLEPPLHTSQNLGENGHSEGAQKVG